jgi:hypothetical protein
VTGNASGERSAAPPRPPWRTSSATCTTQFDTGITPEPQGVTIEEIARLAGHATTRTTEIVYRRELRPVITTGAEIMDQLFTAT